MAVIFRLGSPSSGVYTRSTCPSTIAASPAGVPAQSRPPWSEHMACTVGSGRPSAPVRWRRRWVADGVTDTCARPVPSSPNQRSPVGSIQEHVTTEPRSAASALGAATVWPSRRYGPSCVPIHRCPYVSWARVETGRAARSVRSRALASSRGFTHTHTRPERSVRYTAEWDVPCSRIQPYYLLTALSSA